MDTIIVNILQIIEIIHFYYQVQNYLIYSYIIRASHAAWRLLVTKLHGKHGQEQEITDYAKHFYLIYFSVSNTLVKLFITLKINFNLCLYYKY